MNKCVYKNCDREVRVPFKFGGYCGKHYKLVESYYSKDKRVK